MSHRDTWDARARKFLAAESIAPLPAGAVGVLRREGMLDEIDTHDDQTPSGYRPAEYDTIRAYFDARAANYDRVTAMFYDVEVATLAHLARFLTEQRPRRVVEAGCGTGSALAFLAHAFPRVKFTAYDISPEMALRATARVRRRALANVEVAVGRHDRALEVLRRRRADVIIVKHSFDAGAFPVVPLVGDEAWDEFVRHDPTMVRWQDILDQFHRVLRPNGWFLCIGGNCAGGIPMLVDVAHRCGFRYSSEHRRVLSNEEPIPAALDLETVERFGEEYHICTSFCCALAFQRNER